MTHRRRYKVNSGRLAAIELLALDEFEPALDPLPARREPGRRSRSSPAAESAGPIHPIIARDPAHLYGASLSEPKELSPDRLGALAASLAALSDMIDATYFR